MTRTFKLPVPIKNVSVKHEGRDEALLLNIPPIHHPSGSIFAKSYPNTSH